MRRRRPLLRTSMTNRERTLYQHLAIKQRLEIARDLGDKREADVCYRALNGYVFARAEVMPRIQQQRALALLLLLHEGAA